MPENQPDKIVSIAPAAAGYETSLSESIVLWALTESGKIVPLVQSENGPPTRSRDPEATIRPVRSPGQRR